MKAALARPYSARDLLDLLDREAGDFGDVLGGELHDEEAQNSSKPVVWA